jgi:hypothetical protein
MAALKARSAGGPRWRPKWMTDIFLDGPNGQYTGAEGGDFATPLHQLAAEPERCARPGRESRELGSRFDPTAADEVLLGLNRSLA